MDVYKACNLLILHPELQKAFQYSLIGEYLALFSDGDYATIPSEHDVLICVLPKEHTSNRHNFVHH